MYNFLFAVYLIGSLVLRSLHSCQLFASCLNNTQIFLSFAFISNLQSLNSVWISIFLKSLRKKTQKRLFLSYLGIAFWTSFLSEMRVSRPLDFISFPERILDCHERLTSIIGSLLGCSCLIHPGLHPCARGLRSFAPKIIIQLFLLGVTFYDTRAYSLISRRFVRHKNATTFLPLKMFIVYILWPVYWAWLLKFVGKFLV